MSGVRRHSAPFTISVIALAAVTACGGGSSPLPPVGATASSGTVNSLNTTYTVGGTVSGLVGQGLTIDLLNLATMVHRATVLEQIDIVADGAFVFQIPPSQRYGVAIVHQPHSPAQQCVVRSGQGVIGTANVTDVGIVCGDFAHVTGSTDNTLSAIGIDAPTGAITSVGSEVTAGLSQYAITSTPDSGHLCVGNSGSNDVSVFAVVPRSGALKSVAGSPFAAGKSADFVAPF